MKRTTNLLILAATFAAFAVPALAQTKECTDDFKSTTYQKWYDNRKDHQDIAFQAAEEYLATCPADEGQFAVAIKKFHAAYKAASNAASLKKQFDDAYTKRNYADQMRLGKQIIAAEPDNSAVYIIMGLAGLGEPTLLNEASQYAKKAIEMIEAGKPFAPYKTKDQPLAYLNQAVGKSLPKGSQADAIPYFLKAARLESELKKNPQLYLDLANAYGDGPIAKLSEEYKAKYTTETPESKLALENINQFIDRQIDAFARAAALTSNPEGKKALMDVLTGLYKDRKGSEAGLNELLSNVLSKPIPDIPTPLTTLPTPAASAAPSPAVTPVTVATPTVTTATPKPAAGPKPAKRKPPVKKRRRG